MTRATTTLVVLAAVLGNTIPATLAQSGHNLERPPHWETRADDSDMAVERGFVVMRPGWHVHPGAAGLIWDPASFATGNYSITSTVFLFSPSDEGAKAVDTPYGVFFGGQDLDGQASYATFQIRNDGSFRIAEHTAGGVRATVPWTEHTGIVRLAEPPEGTAKNVLAVDAKDEMVAFYVNDEKVAEVARTKVTVEGTIGLRAGADLSLHITEITVGPNRRDEQPESE